MRWSYVRGTGFLVLGAVIVMGAVLQFQEHRQNKREMDRLTQATTESIERQHAFHEELGRFLPLAQTRMSALEAASNSVDERVKNIAGTLAAIKERVSRLETASATITDKIEPLTRAVLSLPQSHLGERQFAMFDDVSLYQKNGLVENYGLLLRPRQAGPIRIRGTELHITGPNAFVIWTPDHSPTGESDNLIFDAGSSMPAQAYLRIGITTKRGEVYLFDVGNSTQPLDEALPPNFPTEYQPLLKSRHVIRMQRSQGTAWIAVLPPELRSELQSADGEGIKHWSVQVLGAAGVSVRLRSLSLYKRGDGRAHDPAGSQLSGVLKGYPSGAHVSLRLVLENGAVLSSKLTSGNHFKFVHVPRGTPLSLRLSYNNQDYYAGLGRWFVVDGERADLSIDLRPRVPAGTSRTAENINKLNYASSLEGAFVPHSRQKWTGTSEVVDFDTTTFSNNIGQIDRDRFEDNPDGCLRIVQVGSSHVVALQVPIFEKTNILLESDLAVRLQQCVEVISHGVNNGEIAANLPFLDTYLRKLYPKYVLFEHAAYTMYDFEDELYRRAFGYDPKFRHLAAILEAADGTLKPVAASEEYPLYMKTPDHKSIIPDVPFFDTLRVPLDELVPIGQRAYRRFEKVVEFVQARFPESTFVMFTDMDQAQCGFPPWASCRSEIVTAQGKRMSFGPDIFIQNMQSVCEKLSLRCIHPVPPQESRIGNNPLTFGSDGHFNTRGHQWLASAIVEGMESFTAKSPLN